MRKKNNTITTAALIVIITAGLVITSISAYFVSQMHLDNVAGIGYSEENIEETFNNPDIKPNETTIITKKVTIKNTGPNTNAVRVRTEFSKDDVLSYTTVDYNTTDWEKDGDYWYYKTPVTPGATTNPLFNKLTLTNPTADQVSDFDVYVYSECRNCEDDASLNDIKSSFDN